MTVILKVKCVIFVTSSTKRNCKKNLGNPISDQASELENGDISEFSGQNIIEISLVIIYELKNWDNTFLYVLFCNGCVFHTLSL